MKTCGQRTLATDEAGQRMLTDEADTLSTKGERIIRFICSHPLLGSCSHPHEADTLSTKGERIIRFIRSHPLPATTGEKRICFIRSHPLLMLPSAAILQPNKIALARPCARFSWMIGTLFDVKQAFLFTPHMPGCVSKEDERSRTRSYREPLKGYRTIIDSTASGRPI